MPRINDKNLVNLQRLIPVFVRCLVISAVLLVPMKIIGYGYLPSDDALRHTAKAVSGRDWNEILIVRSDVKMDSHPGWHAILGAIHKLMGWSQDALATFSVSFLFILFCLIPVLLLTRPEAWPITLLVVAVMSPILIGRLFLGRPYIFTMSVVLVFSFLWPSLRNKRIPYKTLILLTLLVAASTWIHCCWYIFALPVIAFFLAREWRAGFRMCIAVVVGIMIGAILTGHPYLFLNQTFYHAFRAFSSHKLQRMLVSEFQPFPGDNLMVITVVGMLAWRKIRGAWDRRIIDNPIFILAVSGWVLGFISYRFWLDWGMPATCVWMAQEFKEVLDRRIGFLSWQRLFLTIAIVVTFYIGITNDINSRWTANLTKEYLSANNPEQAPWLPGPGGIIYSDDMTIFYDTFFNNPHAPWRYILGFEPAMMPPEDLAIYRKIQWNFSASKSFRPWVKKMRLEDRLILRHPAGTPPNITELEWNYAATGIWVGRLPEKND